MIKYKNKILIKILKIKFFTHVKTFKLLNAKLITFSTKKIIANRAPKHFNIGQHAMKIRKYNGEYLISLNYSLFTFVPHQFLNTYFYEDLNISKKLSIKSSKIYYNAFFKFN